MDNIFYTNNQYPLGGLMPINIPAVVRGMGRKLRDRMYRTIKPEAYTAENTLNFLNGEPRVYRDPNSEALLGKYTAQDSIIADSSQAPDGFVGGRPLTQAEHKAIGDSIMLGGAENLRKYAVKDLIIPSRSKQGAFEFAYPNQSGNAPHLPANYNDISQNRWTHSKQLGSYYQSKGQDEKGSYITYEDTWDINPWRGKSSSDDPTSAWQTIIKAGRDIGLDKIGDVIPFGRPFKIYGKQYYDKKGKPVKQKAEGGSLNQPRLWDDLSMAEKAEMMKVAVRQGITNLSDIKQKYNEFAEGGSESGGEEDNTLPYNPSMTAMMKSKMATAAHYGNPTARRMTNYDTRSYTFPNEYSYINGIGEPLRGNVFVSSYDNLVTPQIQDNGKSLEFVENVWSPENDQRSYMQSIKFDNPYDAQYFGEHYKEVAPMMNLYAEGGIHIKPSHRGRLTELKKRTGKTEAELYNDGNPAHKRMVVFARNSRRWKHGLGGNLFEEGGNAQNPSDYRYIDGDNYHWDKVNNDDMGRVFQGLTITPNRVKTKFVPERINNSEEGIKQRENFFLYRDEDGNLKGEPGLEIVSPEFDALTLAPLAIQAAKAVGTGTKRVAAEAANKITTRRIIPDDDAHILAADAKYAIKKYINSKQERDRIKAALRRGNENGSHAGWEIDEMNGNLNDTQLTFEPKVYSNGKPVYGVTIRNGKNIDVKLTTRREYPEDFLFTGEHEYGHVTETDKILELLKRDWGNFEVNPKFYTVNGVEDPVLKAYFAGIPENRAMALAVQADMYDKGFSTLSKYLEYLKNNKIMNQQWLKLKALHGEEKAKHLVESVFGLSPLVYMGGKNQ